MASIALRTILWWRCWGYGYFYSSIEIFLNPWWYRLLILPFEFEFHHQSHWSHHYCLKIRFRKCRWCSEISSTVYWWNLNIKTLKNINITENNNPGFFGFSNNDYFEIKPIIISRDFFFKFHGPQYFLLLHRIYCLFCMVMRPKWWILVQNWSLVTLLRLIYIWGWVCLMVIWFAIRMWQ